MQPLFGLINQRVAVKRRQFSPSVCDHRHSTWSPVQQNVGPRLAFTV